MKSTIATILGTVGLGLLKKHTGSTVRLIKKDVVSIELKGYVEIPLSLMKLNNKRARQLKERAHNIWNSDENTGNLGGHIKYKKIKGKGTFLIINAHEYISEVDANLTDDQIMDILKKHIDERIEKMSAVLPINLKKHKINVRPEFLRLDNNHFYRQSIRYNSTKNYNSDIYEDTFSFEIEKRHPETIIVNADTGEEYEPKMKVSKLRKR
jgi:hypothetical protein